MGSTDINEEAPSNIGALRCPVVPNKKYITAGLTALQCIKF